MLNDYNFNLRLRYFTIYIAYTSIYENNLNFFIVSSLLKLVDMPSSKM